MTRRGVRVVVEPLKFDGGRRAHERAGEGERAAYVCSVREVGTARTLLLQRLLADTLVALACSPQELTLRERRVGEHEVEFYYTRKEDADDR